MFTSIQIGTVIGVIILLLYMITILGLVIVIMMENRNPLKTIPWIVVLMSVPGIGLILYFFFGQDNRKQKVISRRIYKRIMKRPQHGAASPDPVLIPDVYRPLMLLLNRSNESTLLYGSKIDIYTEGRSKYEALLEAIGRATDHIHLEYYIFCDDKIGNRIKDALIAKAKEGVEVRVIYDDVGSWSTKQRFFKEMKKAGIEVFAYLPVAFPTLTSKVNYRNHRKIVIIDGKTGFTGGINIADRYNEGVSWGIWRDTHFKVEGKGVHGLQSVFLIDWYVVSKKLVQGKRYYPPVENKCDNVMQIATSGPIGQWRTLLQAIIFCVANAKKSILIQTPYFLPTEGLNQALQSAALGGIDVQLMIPQHSDAPTINMASHSFLDDMVKAGVKVFFYTAGFLHSKVMIFDDEVSCIGSANIDFRSFEHNFEMNLFVYQKDFALRLTRMFTKDLASCERLIPTRWLHRPRLQRMRESFMRLFSPLL